MDSTDTSASLILPDAPFRQWFAAPLDVDPVLGLALVMLVAVVVANAMHQLLRLPRLVSYMLIGALASPPALGLLQRTDLDLWKPLLDLAIAVLLFELGSRLRPRWLLDNRWLSLSCVLEALLAAAAVGVAMTAMGAPVAAALLAAAVAASTSPIVVMASVHELRPRGQVSERLTMMCAMNSVLAVLALKLWPLLGVAGYGTLADDAMRWASSALFVISGSFLLGLAGGWVLDICSRFSRHHATLSVLQIALVMLSAALASTWALSPLLTLLVAGMTARSLMGHRLMVEPGLGSAGAALTVLLFVCMGLLFTIDGWQQTWPWVLALIGARFAGKAVAVALLARPSGLGWRQALALTLALQPMSSLAVLLVVADFSWSSQLPGADATLLQALLVAGTLMQLSGPLWVQLSLQHVAGECAKEPKHATG